MQQELIERCEILNRLYHHYHTQIVENYRKYCFSPIHERQRLQDIEYEYLQLRSVILSQLDYIEHELKEWINNN
jgi:hypothetical protein